MSAGDRRVAVVASTSVYGSIVEAIGGDLVEVTSIVSSVAQDPHAFEPSARDQLAVSRADLVVRNGGGYDAFVDALVDASGSSAPVLTAVDFSVEWAGDTHDVGAADDAGAESSADSAPGADSVAEAGRGHDHDHPAGLNEHVWYEPRTVACLAAAIAAELSHLAPHGAATFDANAAAFDREIHGIEADLVALSAASGGIRIFVTEPVPRGLTDAAGLVDVAPAAFTAAVEDSRDVPPATLLEALALLGSGDIALVVVNAQTGAAETAAVLDRAASAGIRVVELTETLPDGRTYVSWMRSNLGALASVLAP